MTLRDLTGQESGIIVYAGGEVAVLNWGDIGDNCLPALGPFGTMLSWPEDGDDMGDVFDGADMRHVDDITGEIDGSIWIDDDEEDDADGNIILGTDLDIICDDNDDLPQVFLAENPVSGNVYTLRNGTKVIAPDDWN